VPLWFYRENPSRVDEADDGAVSGDKRRFAFEKAGEAWMSDVLHGPAVMVSVSAVAPLRDGLIKKGMIFDFQPSESRHGLQSSHVR
jgi:hypothetical protein